MKKSSPLQIRSPHARLLSRVEEAHQPTPPRTGRDHHHHAAANREEGDERGRENEEKNLAALGSTRPRPGGGRTGTKVEAAPG
jgi:hypothetical protein